jgi:predicted DNA-binding protein (MmcQ/YjbR family)
VKLTIFVLSSHSMNIEEFRAYCLSKPGAGESLPFDEYTLVFKVMNKMFTLTPLDDAFCFSVKTDPEEAESLKERYPCISAARYMDKKHWVMVRPDASIDDHTMKKLIDRSYELVVQKMTRKEREALKKLSL